MKITKNYIDGQVCFCDVRQGQVFTTDDHMIFMRIQEIVAEDGSEINAIYLEDGDTASIRYDEKVKIIDNAELTLTIEI